MNIIDSYTHFVFREVMDFIEEKTGKKHGFSKLFENNPCLTNIDARVKKMDEMGAKINVIVPIPEIGLIPGISDNEELSLKATQICNDAMANMVKKYPNRFCGIATIPTTNSKIMIDELYRSINELELVGASIGISTYSTPIDDPKFEPLFKACEDLNIPLYLHPGLPQSQSDYVDENVSSKYQYYQTYQRINDTTLAMHRIVFSGVFQRYPKLKIIMHHHGGMIPYFAGRIDPTISFSEQNAGINSNALIKPPYINHYKNFYIDTATLSYNPEILKIALDFFGVDHVLFGTDTPMDVTGGQYIFESARDSVKKLEILNTEKKQIFFSNAETMFGI